MAAQALTLEKNRSSQSNSALTGLTPAIPTALICDNPLLRSGLQRILSGSSFGVAEVPSPIGGSRRFQKLIAEAAWS